MPFTYGILVKAVYENGCLFDAAVLALSPADLLSKFMLGVSKVAALSFETGYPTVASVPFQMRYAFKKLVAISLESGYEFKEATDFISGAAAAAASAASVGGPGLGLVVVHVWQQQQQRPRRPRRPPFFLVPS